MSLTYTYEEHEVGSEIRRLYADIRSSFDIPFVPTLFKLLTGNPEYLKLMWRDLGPVAASREFQTASQALDEFIRSQAVGGNWHFNDQGRILAEQKVGTSDLPVLSGMIGIFARELARTLLFSRLLQRGYSGGQPGRVFPGKQSPALSRLITLHVPNEREASLRVWLIYSDIRRFTGMHTIPSLFRALSPFPGYLASSWMECKSISLESRFQHARDAVSRRAGALVDTLPVRDHRALGHNINAPEWREIEKTVDNFARLLPQLALLSAVWQRSFSSTMGEARIA